MDARLRKSNLDVQRHGGARTQDQEHQFESDFPVAPLSPIFKRVKFIGCTADRPIEPPQRTRVVLAR